MTWGLTERARLWTVVPALLAGAGLVAVVVGMFLPWFRSGAVLRDSFQVIGVVKALGFLRGDVLDVALSAWFGIIPVVTLCVVAYTVGMRRTAATICLVLAIITGTISGGATVESGGGDSSLGIADTGPTVTLIGSLVAFIGAVGIFASRRRSASKIAGGEP